MLRLQTDQLIKSGQLNHAETLLRTCRQQWTTAGVVPTDSNMLEAAAYLGQILAVLGQLSEASILLQDAYHQAISSEDPVSRSSIGILAASLGTLHRYQRDSARALPLLRAAHRRFVESRGPKDFSVGLVLLEIGATYAQDGEAYKAERTFLEARDILQESGFREEVMTCDMYVAATHIEQGRLAEAEERIRKALLSVAGAHSTLTDAGVAMGEYHLARIYRLQGRKEAATAQYRKAIDAYQAATVQPFPQLQTVVEEYADFLRKSKAPEAKVWAARARTLRSPR